MSLISKQIDKLRAYAKDRKGELAKLITDAADTIEMLSAKLHASQMARSSQYYHGGWIPCSERLPETEGCYITTARWKDNEPFYVCENEYGFKINEKWNGSDRIFDNGAAFGDMWGDEMDNLMDVIAWMPLPEPYTEEKE